MHPLKSTHCEYVWHLYRQQMTRHISLFLRRRRSGGGPPFRGEHMYATKASFVCSCNFSGRRSPTFSPAAVRTGCIVRDAGTREGPARTAASRKRDSRGLGRGLRGKDFSFRKDRSVRSSQSAGRPNHFSWILPYVPSAWMSAKALLRRCWSASLPFGTTMAMGTGFSMTLRRSTFFLSVGRVWIM